ncbi:MAG TPA: (5-formylfuran-3-yl)methyl phosphate synthase [Methylotenera sp.]|nr:(5-formylfuran-3-yl)methyl phosphate synthase [Methylotenera sp.]
MTKLLISVTSIDEAQLAMDHGADIIDLKDPHSGALGALPLETINEIANYIHLSKNPKPISATIGDIPMQVDLILHQVNLLANTKIDFIKIGFFEADNYHSCLSAIKPIAANLDLIAVLFAEYTYPVNIVEDIKQAGFKGLMLDTAHKNGRTILYYHSRKYCEDLSQNVRKSGMTFGLAGSLKLQDIAILGVSQPTYMGFRGGACTEYSRTENLDRGKIEALSNALKSLL